MKEKNFFNIFFGILSGMFYANSIFSAMVNIILDENKKHNYKIAIKTLLFSIFNPGGGFLMSSVILVDSCKWSREEKCEKSGLIVSFIGILFSLFLMTCPIFYLFWSISSKNN
jgi:hypothetical protein